MYETIYVPVDNSPHSNRAIDCAVRLGKEYQSKLVGCHVYAAKMHDYRFRQMEFTLPEEYLVENELHRQRKIHDSLITMGLELISDCYLQSMDEQCQKNGLECERKMMDGKHTVEILKDIGESSYDLVVLGAVGIGRTKDSQLGAVCRSVAQEADRDVWVVKNLPKKGEVESDTILVCVDGSPQSFGSLMTGVEMAKRFNKKVEVIGVYDPYLHYAVFKGIVEVLTDKAAKIFRFEEQNQLHEEIIDTGLAEIYQSHLNVAETMVREEGLEVTKTLLDGKAFQKVLDHARKTNPWLMIMGRTGVHREDGYEGLGSNTENLLRFSPCDVLLTTSEVTPEIDLKAEESIHWTEEAEARMVRVPEMVLGIAKTAILRLALEKGHSVVTSDLVTEAMERFMPKQTGKSTTKLAEALALDKASREPVAICKQCGVAARVPDPAKCTVCNAEDFETVSQEILEKIARSEGGIEEEITYDGRKLRWTKDARGALRSIEDKYQRRRAKARIEKSARVKKLDPITLDFAQRFVEEETGVLYTPPVRPEIAESDDNSIASPEPVTATSLEEDPELRILARDSKNVPLISAFDWTEGAIERVLRVPSGFMRDRTQSRIEEVAEERGAVEIDLALVEDGIEYGKQMMAEMLGQYGGGEATKPAAEAAPETPAEESCPVDAADSSPGPALNEVGLMSAMEKKRRELNEN
ncbi:MAG: universal stress protein [Deltaproteobacteria bacterium]|nr:universal stress protein [Deltaproteobacteria bacterium]